GTRGARNPAGDFLELGTGTGVATAWLLDGMDRRSRLVSVENDAAVLAVAQKFLGEDRRAGFFHADGGWWLEHAECFRFDLIFADSWPGKYTNLDEALRLLKRGGLYVIAVMLPQQHRADVHAQLADE